VLTESIVTFSDCPEVRAVVHPVRVESLEYCAVESVGFAEATMLEYEVEPEFAFATVRTADEEASASSSAFVIVKLKGILTPTTSDDVVSAFTPSPRTTTRALVVGAAVPDQPDMPEYPEVPE
jgi:hypothetical protein